MSLISGAIAKYHQPIYYGGGILMIALAALSGSAVGGVTIGIAYVFGMSFPLFAMALIWDKARLGERGILRAKAVTLRLGARSLSTSTVNLAVAVAFVIMGVLVTFALGSSRPETETSATPAGAFTMPTSDGGSVSLSDYAGKPVILYFNEGAGCDSCLLQMAAIEANPDFAKQGIAVLPIVMNTAAQINQERDRLGVTTRPSPSTTALSPRNTRRSVPACTLARPATASS